jgi:hypothetical protein
LKIYRKEYGSTPPADNMYFIEAANGRFLYKRNPVLTTVQPITVLPGLAYQQEVFEVNYPKIELADTLKVAAFFYRAYCKFGGEAVVLIYYNKSRGYLFAAPEQQVGDGQLEYSPEGRFKDYLLVGSIHSHGPYMAFHSDGPGESDQKDEVNFDGMHITFGNFNSKVLSISCSIMVDGQRFYLDPLEYLSGFKEEMIPNPCQQTSDGQQAPAAGADPYWAPMAGYSNWDEIVRTSKKEEVLPPFREKLRYWRMRILERFSEFWYGYHRRPLPLDPGVEYLRHPMDPRLPLFFTLEIPDGLTLDNLACPDDWMEKVSMLPFLKRMDYYILGGETCPPSASK